jgi:iron complex outermembrane recepter protein
LLTLVLSLSLLAPPQTPTVRVEAPRPPRPDVTQPVTMIERGRVDGSIAASLRALPGVQISERDTLAQDFKLSIRGFGARGNFGIRGIRLDVDGIPADSSDGQGQLGALDLAAAARIELERGPFSARAAGSPGGSLRVLSDAPDGLGRTIAGGVGTFGQQRVSGEFSAGADHWPSALRIGRFERDGARRFSSGVRDQAALISLLPLAGGHELKLRAEFFRLDNAFDPQGLSAAELADDPRGVSSAVLAFRPRKDVEQTQIGAQWARADSPWSARGWFGERSVAQVLSIAESVQRAPTHPGGVIDFSRRYAGAAIEREAARWLLGFSIDGLDEARRGYLNFDGATRGVRGALKRDERNRLQRAALYGEWRTALGGRSVLALGARVERLNARSRDAFIVTGNPDDSFARDDQAVSPFVRIEHALSPHWRSAFKLGRGFDPPTLGELAYAPEGEGFNRALRAARSTHAEWGARYVAGNAWRIGVALHAADVRNEIEIARAAGGRSAFRNGGPSRRQGLELDWRQRLASGWSWSGALSGLSARRRSATLQCARTAPCAAPSLRLPAGARLPGVAERLASIAVSRRISQGWRLGGRLDAQSNVRANDAATSSAPGFWTLGLHARRRFTIGETKLALNVRVDNLFDRRFVGNVVLNDVNDRFFEPAPGRSVEFAIRVDF